MTEEQEPDTWEELLEWQAQERLAWNRRHYERNHG